MKKILLALSVLAATQFQATAQMPYTVSTSTAVYQELSSGIKLNDTTAWNEDSTFKINIPFAFKINGKPVAQIILSGATIAVTDTGDKADAFSLISTDLIDRGLSDTDSISKSPIRYLVSGSAGSRILKIEAANVGFWEEMDQHNTTNDYANIQLWLYETSNIVEIHYGASKVSNFNVYFQFGVLTGYVKGINMGTGVVDKFYILAGNPSSPNVDSFSLSSPKSGLSSFPTNGTVYRFTPKTNTTSIASTKSLSGIKVYPTHCRDNVTIANNNPLAVYSIVNMQGVTLDSRTIDKGLHTVDISNIPAGMYFIKVTYDNKTSIERIIKQ